MRSSGLHLSGGCYLPSDQLGLLRERPLASLRAHRYSFPGRCSQGTRDLTRIEGANPFEFSLILYKITEISGCFIFFICGTKQFQNTYFAQVSPPKTSPSKNSEDKFQIQIFAQVSPPKTWPSKSFEDKFQIQNFAQVSPPEDLAFKKF